MACGKCGIKGAAGTSLFGRLDGGNRWRRFVLGPEAFGHVGAGGSIGFADPEFAMSMGYAMNKMGKGVLMNDRGQSLIDAAYRCAGANTNESGGWA